MNRGSQRARHLPGQVCGCTQDQKAAKLSVKGIDLFSKFPGNFEAGLDSEVEMKLTCSQL